MSRNIRFAIKRYLFLHAGGVPLFFDDLRDAI